MFNVVKKELESNIWVISDPKFNEVLVSLKILLPLKYETAAAAHVLSKIMNDRLIDAPTKKIMSKRLDDLYGARLSVRNYSVGALQVIDITIRAINSRYVNEDLLKQQIMFVLEVLNTPLINELTFKEAVKYAKLDLIRIQEQSSYYALTEALRIGGEGYTCGIHPDGRLEDFEVLKLEDVITLHKQCLTSFTKELYVTGDVNVDDVPNIKLPQSDVSVQAVTRNVVKKEHSVVQQKTNQTELVLLYETDIHPEHELYFPYLMFLAYLGQGSTSLLFQNVREKHSLCYSIYASQMIFDGVFYIQTSVNPDKEVKALELITEQFDIIRNESLDLSKAKAYLINQIQGTTEDINRLGQFVFRNARLNRADLPETLVEAFSSVTESQVKAVLNHIQTPFVYSYRGNNNEENN